MESLEAMLGYQIDMIATELTIVLHAERWRWKFCRTSKGAGSQGT